MPATRRLRPRSSRRGGKAARGEAEDSSKALSIYLARMAWASPIVRGIRREYFQDRPLGSAGALDFLRSPVARFLPKSSFKRLGISILHRDSALLELTNTRLVPDLDVWIAHIEIIRDGERLLEESRCQLPAVSESGRSQLPVLTFTVDRDRDESIT